MHVDVLLNNLLNPTILFFFLGLLVVVIQSDLSIPQPISRFLSYYLLLSIGLKGGAELAHSGLTPAIYQVLGIAVLMSILVPLYSFFILKRRLNIFDSAAVAATYGSISAVTFITAINFLHDNNVEYGGYMVAAMALMEAPAIIIGLLLVNAYERRQPTEEDSDSEAYSLRAVVREAATNGSVVLIMGSFLIGLVSTPASVEALQPFTQDIFKGMLAFFLLDMGILAGRRLNAMRTAGWFVISFAILVPLVNAAIIIALAVLFQLNKGDALLLTVLCASASYIAVPAAMRISVPRANAGLYVPMALAITFPFNIIVGIPLYFYLLNLLMP
ncbi:MAG: sodium-dependent bicarbonate transport family permease [Lewinellaceae bacterium]|nr:sodium-dependent bicarbonate transport family permease [Lewinellaceae bacterium]